MFHKKLHSLSLHGVPGASSETISAKRNVSARMRSLLSPVCAGSSIVGFHLFYIFTLLQVKLGVLMGTWLAEPCSRSVRFEPF